MNQTALVAPHLMAFLPWLRLREPQTIGGYDFTPYRDREVRPNFAAVSTELERVFSSYVDRNGNPISSPVIVTSPGGNWSRSDDDFSKVAWAARLLFLASWSANRYFEHLGYVGSVPFRPVWQRFTGSSFIGLVAKRRDGTRQDGGYEHGKIKFDIPLQCVLEDADVDSPFLQALNAANASGASVTIERLALDPIPWTPIERWIRWDAWDQAGVAGESGGSSLRSSRKEPSDSSWTRGRRSAPSPASWI